MNKFARVGRSFLSLYFIITFTFIVASWLLDEVWRSYLEQDIESYTGYKTMLHAIEDYIVKNPELEWEQVVSGAAERYELPLKLESIANIKDITDKADRRSLRKGNTYVYYDDDKVELHHLIQGSNTVITLGPTKMPTRPRAEALVRVVLLLILAIIILFWLWPVSRDLDRLKEAAHRFGYGDFSTQAPKAQSSMMTGLVVGFNAMTIRIKNLIESNKELTNAVSHELRTPLARSKFALQMLQNIDDKTKQQKYIEQIHGDIYELEALVNELLAYAALDSDKPELQFKQHKLNDIIARQISLVKDLCPDISFESAENDLVALCDNHFIERALSNYLTNAIKYGDGKVLVTLTEQNDYCIITVEDNGSGIDSSLEATVFEAFTRGEQSRNKETGGFGLGLAIVKRIMDWHHGTVYVENSSLGGARFILKWPIKF
ncbi:two-component sensor histidine kinase [Thalassotalea sp. M1531]|uniref:histidine kinase n=1 Tax=Thalassotalea algicola TaxID=2716224 RepID=A0A7Y0Q7J3_9GAMM|nr:ATP-binding protein [Thalassotalea algicola]NMP32463.1 two-component sensor histidine kinase [Thalassotalea algicola]